MTTQPTRDRKGATRCRVLSLLQLASVISFMAALHGAASHQGDMPPTLFVLWVVATGVLATVSLAISSSCELDEDRRDSLSVDDLHGA